jgi:PIN domain nuclease of toxin-antitoxin system
LLDTSALIWWAGGDAALGPDAAAAIACEGNTVFVSAVTGWEISIKRVIGKFGAVPGADTDHTRESDVAWWMEQGLFEELPLSLRHGSVAGALPLHHRDPFDRMLVAQAQVEGLVLLTPDATLRRYDVPVMDART